MLRPATPLTVLLLAAFCLLLLAVLSTPVIQAIPLGSFEGATFGVFGFCKDGVCSPIEVGYDARFEVANEEGSFNLPTSTRATLSAILIVHPVAALLTLVMLIMAIVAHMHSPSHSARYLLIVFIVGIVDFLLCLLSFLVDVLLFVPHMAWGSYLVLAATILVALSGLISCAMRRTVVSRKARKKRIAENAEMSGENYYNRQAQQVPGVTAVGALQPTVPVVSSSGADGLPSFATYEKKDDRSSDERVPLTARSPSENAPAGTTLVNDSSTSPMDNASRRSLTNTPGSRDQYGNPLPPQVDAYGVRRGPSMERMNGRGRGGMPPGGYRGRGGYPGPGRGGYNGYGPTPPPGGRGPPGRGGGYGSPINRGGYGPPQRGYGGPGMRGGRTPPPPPSYQGNSAYDNAYDSAYDRRPSPAGAYGPGPYGARQASPGPPSAPGYGNQSAGPYEAYTPQTDNLPRAESPPPLPGIDDGVNRGQVVEMDASSTGSAPAPGGVGQYGIRDSDADVAGMLAMQQARVSPANRHDTYMSTGSTYSQDESYVPPRQAWNQGPGGRSSPSVPSPLNPGGRAVERAELSTRGSPAPPAPAPVAADAGYYEDVDPRFAEPGYSGYSARAPQSGRI